MPASEPARVPANEINAIRIWSVKKSPPTYRLKKGEIALNNAISPKFLYIYFLKRLFFSIRIIATV